MQNDAKRAKQLQQLNKRARRLHSTPGLCKFSGRSSGVWDLNMLQEHKRERERQSKHRTCLFGRAVNGELEPASDCQRSFRGIKSQCDQSPVSLMPAARINN